MGGGGMKLSIEDFRQALDAIGDSGGAEAAIVATSRSTLQ